MVFSDGPEAKDAVARLEGYCGACLLGAGFGAAGLCPQVKLLCCSSCNITDLRTESCSSAIETVVSAVEVLSCALESKNYAILFGVSFAERFCLCLFETFYSDRTL